MASPFSAGLDTHPWIAYCRCQRRPCRLPSGGGMALGTWLAWTSWIRGKPESRPGYDEGAGGACGSLGILAFTFKGNPSWTGDERLRLQGHEGHRT